MPACSSCGSELAEQNRFCPVCGAPAGSDAFATQTVAAAAAPRRAPSSSGRTATRSSSSRSAQEGRFAPGAVLAGRYRIVALLGKGGMGEVYRADDLQLDQAVALKFLPESLSENENAAARFRNEVRTARQVSHPNVCRVYDLTQIEGLLVLSMEYVDGEDLGSLLRRIGRLPGDKALEIARKLCAGLAAAHEKGVLHRDLKPSNVMLDARGQVLLTDFGLAGLAGEIEGSEVRNGTPAYMAPEQLAGLEVTVKSDIYALGLVLYEIFTGKLPFESETLAGLIQARAESTPPNPTTLVRELDPLVEKVILRCLQAKPSQRPASALAVSAALPGGDRLAAALALGETPSPDMVADAGEGHGLSPLVALPLLATVLGVLAACAWVAVPRSALDRMDAPYTSDVLVQKARDLVTSAGFPAKPGDIAYGFQWYDAFTGWVDGNDKPKPKWNDVLKSQPSALQFWYRQAAGELVGGNIHDDWLTPGIVTQSDPPFTESRMVNIVLDDHGRLIEFERLPVQHQAELKSPPREIDWGPLFKAAGLDPAQLKPADPEWTWLSSNDTRTAWTGTWPGTSRPLRVEAAALRGRPMAFMVMGPWTGPWRDADTGPTPPVLFLLTGIVVVVLTTGPWLARRNFLKGRGDRRGAFRLGCFFFGVLLLRWLLRAHLPASLSTFGLFLLALATALFYGVVIWMVYLAVEPYVRRRWPQSLISWTAVLSGRFRDPVVGRDVLVGSALGASFPAANVLLNWPDWKNLAPNYGSTAPLNGLRSTLELMVVQIPQGIRLGVFALFLIFLLRVVLRNQWLAGAAFAVTFSFVNFFQNGNAWQAFWAAFVIYSLIALVMLRWGLLASCVGIVLANVAGAAPPSTHASVWYFANSVLPLAVVLALMLWGTWISLGGRRILKAEWFD
jgi:serine/threonine-protein kinase